MAIRTLPFAGALVAAALLSACGGTSETAADASANATLQADPMFEASGANDVTAIDAAGMGNAMPIGAGTDLANASDGTAMTNDMTSDIEADARANQM